MLRRRFLEGALASAALPALVTGWSLAARAAPARGATPVRLGTWGSVCEAATVTAPGNPSFLRERLAPRVVAFSSQPALLAALDRGLVDAASVNLPALLAPLAAGSRVRVVAGLHAGCLRVLAASAVEFNSINDLKGTTVATDRLGGSAMSLFSAILHRAGLDPRRDITWRTVPHAELETALGTKAVSCVAAADPLGYDLMTEHVAEPYLDSSDGGFSCGGDIAPGHHCFLVLGARLIENRPVVAAALTRAYLAATAAIGRGVGPAAVGEASGPLHPDIHAVLGMLASYDWTASTLTVLEELELTARDFRRAGLLAPDVDAQALAARAFADVLHA